MGWVEGVDAMEFELCDWMPPWRYFPFECGAHCASRIDPPQYSDCVPKSLGTISEAATEVFRIGESGLRGRGKTYFGDVMGLDEEWGCGHRESHVEKRI